MKHGVRNNQPQTIASVASGTVPASNQGTPLKRAQEQVAAARNQASYCGNLSDALRVLQKAKKQVPLRPRGFTTWSRQNQRGYNALRKTLLNDIKMLTSQLVQIRYAEITGSRANKTLTGAERTQGRADKDLKKTERHEVKSNSFSSVYKESINWLARKNPIAAGFLASGNVRELTQGASSDVCRDLEHVFERLHKAARPRGWSTSSLLARLGWAANEAAHQRRFSKADFTTMSTHQLHTRATELRQEISGLKERYDPQTASSLKRSARANFKTAKVVARNARQSVQRAKGTIRTEHTKAANLISALRSPEHTNVKPR